ncbi:MAG TPA: MarR family transcriptional regulator [Streptosporangiaceae bacterium]|jgi:DNA-binding MarR family transcriptional regulator
MRSDVAEQHGNAELDVGTAECGLAVLIDLCDRAVEEIGSSVPPAQLRALLVLDRAGCLNLNGLAVALAASASAVSRLLDRMQAGGLITRRRAVASRREVLVVPTESGRRLVRWVRGMRRAEIGKLLDQMTAEGREALARGLCELAATGTRPR